MRAIILALFLLASCTQGIRMSGSVSVVKSIKWHCVCEDGRVFFDLESDAECIEKCEKK